MIGIYKGGRADRRKSGAHKKGQAEDRMTPCDQSEGETVKQAAGEGRVDRQMIRRTDNEERDG